MKDKKIGHIIKNGGTIKDLQNEISDFPSKPTVAYFIQLGYAKSTAKNYVRLLKNADLEKFKKLTFFKSASADYKNLLIDTCALALSSAKIFIENAEYVTFLYPTLEEMDKKQNNNHLQERISYYSKLMLQDNDKYLLSKFSGLGTTTYVDNILIQYLYILPKQIRPTLLTADKNLADKAKCFDLDFIYLPHKQSVTKNLGYGIQLIKNEEHLLIIVYGNVKVEILKKNGEKYKYNTPGKMQPVNKTDTLIVYTNSKNHSKKVINLSNINI